MRKKSNVKNLTVLITGCGGPAISGMIANLKKLGFRVIAVDILKNSAGFYIADKGYIVPAGDHLDFLPAIHKICIKEKVDVVISVVDEELMKVSKLEECGIAVIQPRSAFIEMCLDKYKCMKAMDGEGIEVPNTWRLIDLPENVEYPLIIKPRTGRGSRGFRKLESKSDLKEYINSTTYSLNDLIVQSLIVGTEFTVSVVVWRDGKVQAVVPKEIVSKVGVTKCAITRKNEKIDDLCRKIQEKFHADGPFNLQLILDDAGTPYPIEINPRFSTSITLTASAGIDELGGLITQAIAGPESYNFESWSEGIVLVRQTVDFFINEEKYTEINKNAILN